MRQAPALATPPLDEAALPAAMARLMGLLLRGADAAEIVSSIDALVVEAERDDSEYSRYLAEMFRRFRAVLVPDPPLSGRPGPRPPRIGTGEAESATHELLTAADTGWLRERAGISVVDFDGGYALFDADDAQAAQAVLREALTHGDVTSFAPLRPTLAQIFKEVIQ